MTEPTWKNQLAEADKLDTKALGRHASVSSFNNHRCRECFCCAALTVLEQRLRDAARKGTDKGDNDFAKGAYAMIQALTGNGSIDEVIDGCTNG